MNGLESIKVFSQPLFESFIMRDRGMRFFKIRQSAFPGFWIILVASRIAPGNIADTEMYRNGGRPYPSGRGLV